MTREMQDKPGALRDALYKLWRKFRHSFSSTEILTGSVWIDGKPIYRKVLDTGALPDTDTSDVAHGIVGIGTVVSLRGGATNGTLQLTLPHPGGHILHNVDEGGAALYTILVASIGITIDATEVHLTSYEDVSTYDESFVVIEYTKA